MIAITKKLIIALTVLPFITHANSNEEVSRYLDVKDKYAQSDRELNEIYSHQMQQYKKEGAEFYGQILSKDIFLKKSQQVWIKFRDASCDYETYESQTGTGYQSIYAQCLLDKTNERIRYLKENN